jgi:hypothetical protein
VIRDEGREESAKIIGISAYRERDMETNYISGAMGTTHVLDVRYFEVVYSGKIHGRNGQQD